MKGGGGTFYVKNGILKSKGLDLGEEPPYETLLSTPRAGPRNYYTAPYTETCKSSTSLP